MIRLEKVYQVDAISVFDKKHEAIICVNKQQQKYYEKFFVVINYSSLNSPNTVENEA